MALNLQNLRVPTSEEARKNGAAGGKASAKARRKRMEFKKLLETALAQKYEVNGQEMTVAEGMTLAIIERALSGDCKAWELVRDTMGQKPVDRKEEHISGGLSIKWSE